MMLQNVGDGGAKMVEEWDRETTFSPTNSSKEQQNSEEFHKTTSDR